jgi:hypothetical protein
MDDAHHSGERSSAIRGWTLGAMLVGVFLVGAGVLWGLGWERGRAACDQNDYHLRVILKFARELPSPDLRDYLSATTPGYHLVLAAVARWMTANTVALQMLAAVFTVGMLGVFGWMLAREGRRGGGWVHALVLGVPVVMSQYVFGSGVWLLPDNAGWLAVLAVIAMCWSVRRVSAAWLAGCAVLLVGTVLVRQSHLWVAGVVVASAWLAGTREEDGCLADAIARPSRRIGGTALALLACVPAVAVLAWFAQLWHGLMPPTFQPQHAVKGGAGVNWATGPFILSLVAGYSVFYIGHVRAGLVRVWREAAWVLWAAAGVGLVWGALPETTYMREPRASGLWNAVKMLEDRGIVIAHHTSPLIVVMAMVGAVMLVGWLALVEGKRRWIVAAVIAAFVAAQSANANCWQRYHEPLLLMVFALVAAGARPVEREGRAWGVVRTVGPLGLGVALAVLTIVGLFKG